MVKYLLLNPHTYDLLATYYISYLLPIYYINCITYLIINYTYYLNFNLFNK